MTQVIVVDGKVKAEGLEFGINDVKKVEYGRTAFGKALIVPTLVFFLWSLAGFAVAIVGFASKVIAETLGVAVGALIVLLIAQGFASWSKRHYSIRFNLTNGQTVQYTVHQSTAEKVSA